MTTGPSLETALHQVVDAALAAYDVLIENQRGQALADAIEILVRNTTEVQRVHREQRGSS